MVGSVVDRGIAGLVVHLGHHEEHELLVVVGVAHKHQGNHHIGSESGVGSLK